ncbi:MULTISPECIES: DUF445 domain-containing protein [Cetobacterium]|uniref:DUF445 domain-containing protein n=1 Tax=Cetobacterium somerae ATCC BAA-474 TaxID=1319815 RepID=U7VCW9_9FUSO|nr:MULTISPECIES: DUF445 family protein [Cetobacterium]ERT69380.1 hypothetical protein HMPREF0202_00742 [Cetobacterium somerae ATCC BAA-474]MBC2852869.1 DUF445 family protein [Cetobacterium sp. 2G large]MCX3067987.1 DUF445 family protein [Cetobacterium somerae]UPO97077.1 DUF445 family protein [Cetobacterium somerae]WVJ01055.1 DUF445 family protein [Cetobacterium somerae]
MLVKALLLIVIGSMIGWVTNYIAIKMLFRPYKEINLGFFKIQGLIPKRRHEIGITLADTIQNELISLDDITKKLENANLDVEMERVIDSILEKKLASEITTRFPMIAMFLNESALNKIKDAIKGSIMENKDQIIGMLFETLEKNVDFKEIIVEKVDGFSLEELERITFSLAKKELKHIEIIGAILGGLIGVVQFVITVFI